MKNIFSVLSALIIIIILASCGPSAVVVKERPVAPVYVRPSAPPRAGYIWVEPGYVRSGRGYAYRQGYWMPPRPNRVYHQGYWKNTRRGYVYVPGRW